jgi:DNA mismatch repair protein MutS
MLDGLSIAWAVIEYLHDVIGCRTLASTHFHQLSHMSSSLPRVGSYHVTAHHSPEHGITFTFKVMVSRNEY